MDVGKQRVRESEPLAPHTVQAPSTWKLFVIPIVVVALLAGAVLTIQQRLGTSPSSLLGGPGKGTTAATFTAPSLNGPRFSLAAERGHPVVLFFMAASCTSCLLESNALGQIQHKYGSNVRIALIDIGKGDSSSALHAFVQRSAGPSRFWILDSNGKLASTYGVQSLDTTYVVDRGGRIVYSTRLPVGFGELDRAVRQVA
jgi:peroxiredoxin